MLDSNPYNMRVEIGAKIQQSWLELGSSLTGRPNDARQQMIFLSFISRWEATLIAMGFNRDDFKIEAVINGKSVSLLLDLYVRERNNAHKR